MDTGIGYMIQVISYMEVCIEDTSSNTFKHKTWPSLDIPEGIPY